MVRDQEEAGPLTFRHLHTALKLNSLRWFRRFRRKCGGLSPKTGTIATLHHSPQAVAPSSISPRRSWRSTFQRLRNGETLKNRGNAMLKAGEGCPTPLFRGAEGRGRRESIKRRFEGPNGIEARFRLLLEGFVRGRVRV